MKLKNFVSGLTILESLQREAGDAIFTSRNAIYVSGVPGPEKLPETTPILKELGWRWNETQKAWVFIT